MRLGQLRDLGILRVDVAVLPTAPSIVALQTNGAGTRRLIALRLDAANEDFATDLGPGRTSKIVQREKDLCTQDKGSISILRVNVRVRCMHVRGR